MASNLNDPNGTGTEHVNHGARKVDIGPERKSKSWLWLLLLLLLAILAWLFWPKKHDDVAPVTTATDVASPMASDDVDVTAASPGATPPAPAIPTGSGVVSDMRDGKPALVVYFETGKSDVSKDLTAASSSVKSYLDAHAGSTLAVSGFNDPTGNAAANAALSKRRAEEVSKALAATGIPASAIKMEKPAETTGTGDSNAQSRRVEVVVKG